MFYLVLAYPLSDYPPPRQVACRLVFLFEYTCVEPPTKRMSFRRVCAQVYDWKHLYMRFLLVRHIPSLCHNLSYTFDPKMHNPAMDSWVL